VQKLTKRGVRIEFVKECLTFTGEDSPMANLMLSVMGAFAEFERALIRERQREGIALAKQRGAYRGRKKALSPEQAAELRQRAAAGEQKVETGARVRHQPGDLVSIPENGSLTMPRRSILSAAERTACWRCPNTKTI
jgi:DNA invertase Pin-like site-specific DNA recombinase